MAQRAWKSWAVKPYAVFVWITLILNIFFPIQWSESLALYVQVAVKRRFFEFSQQEGGLAIANILYDQKTVVIATECSSGIFVSKVNNEFLSLHFALLPVSMLHIQKCGRWSPL